MYRLRERTRVSRSAALEFVLRDSQFPRACLFCLQDVGRLLRALPKSAAVMGSLAVACTFLKEADLEALDQSGLHQLIDLLQLHINAVHQGIAHTYFPPRLSAEPPTQEQTQSAAVAPRGAHAGAHQEDATAG
jgi:uncharacterized alpha-E superfamily protein